MNVPPRAEIRLEGDLVTVTGVALHDERDRLLFEAILGAERTEDGWHCQVHSGDGEALVLRVTRHLQSSGRDVSATSDRAQQAIERDIERLRSFERTQIAALAWNANQDGEAPAPQTQDVLAALELAGWDNQARRLRPHQLAGAMHALTATNTANFSVPGAGKTATTLAVFATHLQQNTIDCALVVGPLSAFAPWEHEAASALPGRTRVRRVRGNPAGRHTMLSGAEHGDVLLMTYPTAASDLVDIEQLCSRMQVMLVVDESHRVKKFNGGLWAPALVAIALRSRVKIILSGTPMPQSPLDLWSQFMILWPGGELTGPAGRYRSRVRNNFDAVRDELRPFFLRTPKRALGLPDYHLYYPAVPFAPIQAEIYAAVADGLRQIAAASPITDRMDRLRRARPIRLLQAASNPDLLNDEDGFYGLPRVENPPAGVLDRLRQYRTLGELPAKFAWGLEYLRDLQNQDPPQKCVVWTSFVRNIGQFAECVERELGGPVFQVHGGVPAAEEGDPGDTDEDETREERIDAFLTTEGFAVLIANPAACAESISLHSSCHRALYLDRTYDCARWLQSIDRIHRLGLPADVHVQIQVPLANLDGRDAIDALVDGSLRGKQQRMEALLAGAELVPEHLEERDTLDTAEGNTEDLEAVLRYLLGEDMNVPAG